MSRTWLIRRNLPAESWPGKGREGERERQDRESKEREREKKYNLKYKHIRPNIHNTEHEKSNILDRFWQWTLDRKS